MHNFFDQFAAQARRERIQREADEERRARELEKEVRRRKPEVQKGVVIDDITLRDL